MNTERFVECVARLRFSDTFNPYADRCGAHDLPDAPLRRAKALRKILAAAADREIDAIWIGRDLGYRGGRRTGLALTDDVNIPEHARRWGISIERATTGQAVAERTAAVIWRVLGNVSSHVFLWNVFPLHPHEPGLPLSNRSHTRREREAGEEILAALVSMLRPTRLVAIGNDASASASRIAPVGRALSVRHPSYGGQNIFLRQMADLYPQSNRQATML